MPAPDTVLPSALLAGVLDLAATSLVMRRQGVRSKRLLQFIASGALGPVAFEKDVYVVLGLGFHFLVALLAAGVYFAATRRAALCLDHPWLSGALFGVVVHLVMSRVVAPLSRTPKRPFSAQAFLIQLGIHIVCVGWPIALTQRYLA